MKKTRLLFTFPEELKAELYKKVEKGKRSKFVSERVKEGLSEFEKVDLSVGNENTE